VRPVAPVRITTQVTEADVERWKAEFLQKLAAYGGGTVPKSFILIKFVACVDSASLVDCKVVYKFRDFRTKEFYAFSKDDNSAIDRIVRDTVVKMKEISRYVWLEDHVSIPTAVICDVYELPQMEEDPGIGALLQVLVAKNPEKKERLLKLYSDDFCSPTETLSMLAWYLQLNETMNYKFVDDATIPDEKPCTPMINMLQLVKRAILSCWNEADHHWNRGLIRGMVLMVLLSNIPLPIEVVLIELLPVVTYCWGLPPITHITANTTM
jgi:hypothetical protein